ncbi:FAD-dependent oxidoreductase [Pendulispora brunnea]|uniref:FAD-dependent oxidoreductase n=1 Tax=Pendulispora brunnea TaxID=2905690 RepID=A0ABZ2K300_9BACT
MTRSNVVVVGGGLAGLCAALRAVRAGAAVTLLERAERLGGRGASDDEKGWVFNQGPHALYLGGHAERVLRAMDVPFDGLVFKSAHRFVELGGRVHPMPSGTVSMLASGLIGVGGKLELASAMNALAHDEGLEAVPLAAWVGRVKNAEARVFLAALFRVATYCADHERISAAWAMRQLRMTLAHGVTYLHGGWQSLVDRLADRARQAGVRIHTGVAPTRVERVAREGRHLAVHLPDGGELVADAVVLAVGPRAAVNLVPESASLARAASDAVPVRAACLDVALRALPNPRHHFTLGLDRADYLSVHSAFARLAPEGGAVIHVARYLAGETVKPGVVRAELEGVLDRAQPGWRSHVAHTRFLPAMTVVNDLPRASARGVRTPVAVADVPRLFLAGDWVGDEGMLADGAFASAYRAADLALEATTLRDVA